jgi:hypothetical protein
MFDADPVIERHAQRPPGLDDHFCGRIPGGSCRSCGLMTHRERTREERREDKRAHRYHSRSLLPCLSVSLPNLDRSGPVSRREKSG